MKTLYLYFLLIVFLVFACKEDKPTNNVDDIPSGLNFSINIEHLFNGEIVKFGDQHYTNYAGNDITFNRLRYFISKITFEDFEGNSTTLENDYFLIDPLNNNNTLKIRELEPGNYKKISFNVGIDSATNHSDPNRYSASSPLSLINHNLHWGWAGGYIFLSLEGNIHYMGNFQSFAYHIGFLKNLKRVILESPIEVRQDGSVYVQFHLDKIFYNPNIIDQSNEFMVTHSTNDNGLAERLTQNLIDVFNIKGN